MPATYPSITFDAELAIARQSLYRFAALSLLDPKAGSWKALDALRSDRLLIAAATLVRETPEAIPDEFALGERALAELDPSQVLACLPHSHEQFNQEYEDTFGLLVVNACPPYETEYIPSKFTFQRSQSLADINGFYRAFGLTTSSTLPERPDHIVQELEFMAFLVGLERQAGSLSPVHDERMSICRNAQTRFVREHLAWWAPAFAKLLSRESPHGFFVAVGQLLAALVPAERALLNVAMPTPTQLAAPSMVEQPDACEGCQLSVDPV
jgi:TorA maturation chaperone TorD